MVPTNNGVRLDDEQYRTPIRPDSGKDRPEDPITLSQPRTFGLLQQNYELLPQREILGRKFRSVT